MMKKITAFVFLLLTLVIALPIGLAQSDSPGDLFANDMVYHPQLEQVLILNGTTGDDPTNDVNELWGWDGSTWTLFGEIEPPNRVLAGVAYDTAREKLVLFGGGTWTEKFGDTWEWDGETWERIDVEAPVARDHIAMIYDAKHGYSLFFGGLENQTTIHNDTWGWDGESWTQLASGEGAPEPRGHYALVYDAAREEVLMFGGNAADLSGNNELWRWTGSAWELIETEVAPPVRDAARMAFDAKTEQVIMFGGRDRRILLDDTWAWDGEQWTELHPENSPEARALHSMAYDPIRERIVLYGGWAGGSQGFDDLWEWDGENWIEIE